MILFLKIRGTMKIPLCSTINPRCPNTKLTTTKAEGKPSYLTSKDYYPKAYHSVDGWILLVMLLPSVVKFPLVPFGYIHPKSKSDEYALLISFHH